MHFPILTSLVALPVAGAILLLFVRGDEEQSAPFARKIALIVSLLVFAETLLLWSRFDAGSGDFQFVERHAWIPAFGVEYYIGVDGIISDRPDLVRSALRERGMALPASSPVSP